MLILNTETKIEFIPTKERDKEKPLTFILTPPTYETVLNIQQAFFVDNSDDEQPKVTVDNAQIAKVLLSSCVVGWKNVYTYDGDRLVEIPFSQEKLKLLTDIEIISELIGKINELGEVEKKSKAD